MRGQVVAAILGHFLKAFTGIIAAPIPIGIYYGEPLINLIGFFYASIACLVLGLSLNKIGDYEEPSVGEAMISTVFGWVIAIVLGAIPFMVEMSLVDATFEAAAGLTTTGISLFLTPEALPNSLLFWRALMQWVGGLGVLTFFIAVIRESGGISRKLFSAETHKTDPGSIRPSLKKSILELWKVYIFVTVFFIAIYSALGMNLFNAVAHSFSGISTGGFSTIAGSIGAFNQMIQMATVLLMFLGGMNFVLIYRGLNMDFSIINNSEFRLYSKIFLLFSGLIMLDIWRQGLDASMFDAFFQSAAILSSTGYATMGLLGFSVFMQFFIVGIMFMGGSVGSTSGGVKTFRIMTMYKMLKNQIKSYSLPDTAINKVKIDGEILENETLQTISVLVFTWLFVIFVGTGLVMMIEDVSLIGALSGTVSTAGNMGPVFMESGDMVSLSNTVKLIWVAVMIAGRLEMLPALAIFNRKVLSS